MSAPAILCTRPEGERDPLVGRLRALGWTVHAVPTVVTEPLPFAVPDLAAFDWVVVTSATGVQALLDRVPTPPGTRPRWAAVGPRTAAALRERGVTAAAVPTQNRGVHIAEAIAAATPRRGLRVLLARADAAAADLPRALRAAGATVEDLPVYHTVIGPDTSRSAARTALDDRELRAAVFASGSAIRGLLLLGGDHARHTPAVTIGPATTAVAREEGLQVVAEAARPGVDELVDAIQKWHRQI